MLMGRYQERKKTSCMGEKGYDMCYIKISKKAERDRIQSLGAAIPSLGWREGQWNNKDERWEINGGLQFSPIEYLLSA